MFQNTRGNPTNNNAHKHLSNKKIDKKGGTPAKGRRDILTFSTFSTKPNIILTPGLMYTHAAI
jgi:hypothetical protein